MLLNLTENLEIESVSTLVSNQKPTGPQSGPILFQNVFLRQTLIELTN